MWTPFGQVADREPEPITVNEHDPWKAANKAIENRVSRSKIHYPRKTEGIDQAVLNSQEIDSVKQQRSGRIVVAEVITQQETPQEQSESGE